MRCWRVILVGLCALSALCALAGCNGRGSKRARRPQTAPAPPREQASPIDTPEKLLRKILALASNKRYDELGPYVLPLHLPRASDGTVGPNPAGRAEPRDVRSEILQGIRSREGTGDFAYSNEALLAVITNHLDRIGPVPRELLEAWAAGSGLGQDPALQRIAKSGDGGLCCFNRSGTFILMRKVGGEYRLLYWKDLNHVLGEAATNAADTRRYHDLAPLTVKLQGGKFLRAAVSVVTRADRADTAAILLRTKNEEVQRWLAMFLERQKADDLADKAKLEHLGAEARDGLNQLLNLQDDAAIDSVIFRELAVQ